jgi:hypothetical protein
MHPSYLYPPFRRLDSTVADSSTDSGKKDKPNTTSTNPLMTKNIINYSSDSLSIASVVSGTSPQAQAIPVSPKTSQANNKISLVPTKLLLKPQTINSNFKTNPTIVYSSVQSSTSVAGTITTNAQSSIPMKVVFVNAMNNNANAQQINQKPQQITLTNNKSLGQLQQSNNSAFLTSKLLTSSQGQKVRIVQSSQFNSVPKVTTTVNNGESSVKGSKGLLGTKLPGMR